MGKYIQGVYKVRMKGERMKLNPAKRKLIRIYIYFTKVINNIE